ncbi:MAG: TonB family protein [Crocinitomix sp.]|jgi:TonB family protein
MVILRRKDAIFIPQKLKAMKFLYLLLIWPIFSFAQEEVPDVPQEIVPSSQVYDFVEEEPEFPGGMDAMTVYIANNIEYPAASIERDEQGIVYVKFVVGKDGSVSNVGIRKGVSTALDTEAKRVIAGMPKWKPGENNGEIVAVNFTIPVHFRLSNSYKKPNNEEIEFEISDVVAEPAPADSTDEDVFDFVEEEPEFPGGREAMTQFIVNNIEYPEEARKNNEEGIVYVKFVVEKDGAITKVNIRKGVYDALNNEAMRVVKKMPNWIPGEQNGKPVSVYFTLPIHFRLGGTNNSEETPAPPKRPLTKEEQKIADKEAKKSAKKRKKDAKAWAKSMLKEQKRLEKAE